MMQLYAHDFSEQWAGSERGELDEHGRFVDYPLEPYWRDPDHIPLLLRSDGHLIGFALLNAEAHSGRPTDRNMAEFFIVRKHRRGGLGTLAAHAIFALYPGQWEAAVARRNLAALAFWRRAAASDPQVSEIEEIDLDDASWNGPVIRFRVGAGA
ncbi:GNAT family N-acetyltransferase [Phenylobacterium montanum]|uniref:GNAT family N-acetyltransferase n=2 Tax=Phenylobacterium montanum TaxID=2823693 RepID=A0A975G513_9CAUL|nr:GNAT family N-acetyltransferase [Caulobacter sp. S6]